MLHGKHFPAASGLPSNFPQVGYERNEMDYEDAWQALISAKGWVGWDLFHSEGLVLSTINILDVLFSVKPRYQPQSGSTCMFNVLQYESNVYFIPVKRLSPIFDVFILRVGQQWLKKQHWCFC